MSAKDGTGLASGHTESDEIGSVVASLLSSENRWISAQNIEVAGGYII